MDTVITWVIINVATNNMPYFGPKQPKSAPRRCKRETCDHFACFVHCVRRLEA